jgi:hypothetical protein
MTLSVHETLKAMRELLSDKNRWTQVFTARDAKGEQVPSDSPSAVCWCLLGAANKITQYKHQYSLIRKALNVNDVAHFNDTHTHAEVLAKLDDAIKATEKA